ncbi:MAG TPA: hypothetical protein VGE47_16915 [Burkholderiaceae bacterium]
MKIAAALLVILLCNHASAQTQTRETTIYRCGPEGRELRNTPCPAGTAASAQSLRYDDPSAAQTAEARARVKAERARADRMEADRLAAEAQARQPAKTAKAAKAPKPPASAASSARKAKPQRYRLVAPPKPASSPR